MVSVSTPLSGVRWQPRVMVNPFRSCRQGVLACLLVLLFFAPQSDAVLANPPTLPTRNQCLYFSDNNGVAQVLGFNATQGALVAAAQKKSNNTNLIDQVTSRRFSCVYV